MNVFTTEEAGENTLLRTRLLAEADVVTIAPPPTLAVRAAGTERIQRRRVLQAASGAVAACAIAGAVLAWSPRDSRVTPVGPAASHAPSSPHTVDPPLASSRPSQWPTAFEPDLPGYLRTKDLGPGWVGPYAIPEQNVSPTLPGILACAGSEGQFISAHIAPRAVFRIFNRTDNSTALVEAVYTFNKGQAAYAMSVIRGTSQNCKDFGGIIHGTPSAGDESIVLGRSPNPSNVRTWLMLIRRGDRIAFVSTSAPESVADANTWRNTTELEIAARLTGP